MEIDDRELQHDMFHELASGDDSDAQSTASAAPSTATTAPSATPSLVAGAAAAAPLPNDVDEDIRDFNFLDSFLSTQAVHGSTTESD